MHAKEWSESKAIKCAVKDIISSITYPDMSAHLHAATALTLQFIDYWEVCIATVYTVLLVSFLLQPQTKWMGLDLLQHIISNVSPSELRQYDLVKALYSRLDQLLHTREEEMISRVLSCIELVLPIVRV